MFVREVSLSGGTPPLSTIGELGGLPSQDDIEKRC